MPTQITAGNSVNPQGVFTGGNDGAFSLVVGQNTAQRTVISATTSGILPYYNNTATASTTSSFAFDGTSGQIQLITLTNAITLTLSAPTSITEGAQYTLILKAGDTSSRSLSWNSAYKFPGASSPLLSASTTTGAYDIISFIGGAGNTLYYTGSLTDVR